VIGAYLANQYNEEASIAEEFANDVLGGQFISRINMNLREDKHWTYGARSVVLDTQGQRPIMAYSSVQKDKTAESILEIRKEFEQFNTTQPVTSDEFVKNQRNAILALPGQWETNAAVANSLTTIVKWNLPDNYYQLYPQKLQQVSLEDVHAASQTMFNAEALNWFVVGDLEIITPSLKEIGFDKIMRVDAEGNEIEIL
jgi:predicted Zn-dependent peptidase